MLFNSYEFVFLYLPAVFLLFFALAKFRGQQVATFFLVLASFFFYGWWDFRYVPLLFVSIRFNYWIGGQIRCGDHIVLPLGISFFTFTQTAYLVEEYRGEVADHSFLTYCEFVTIFPHLVAGPIIRHRDMIPQFTDAKNLVSSLFSMGYEQ